MLKSIAVTATALAVAAAGLAGTAPPAAAKDGKGTDFKGGSLGTVGWTERAY